MRLIAILLAFCLFAAAPASAQLAVNARGVTFVPPSGGDDAPSIQQALDAMLFDYKTDKQTGTVYLAGRYEIGAPLVSGDPDDGYKQAVAIRGLGHATLVYTGPRTDDYLLRMHGAAKRNWGHARTILDNIKLDCNWNCRGLLLQRQYHFQHVSNLYIRGARQSALDRTTCWMSPMTNIHIENGIGFAMRDDTTEGIDIRMFRVGYYHTAIHADDYADRNNPDAHWRATSEMIDYEGEHGIAETKEKYGNKYLEDWPPVKDESIRNRSETTPRPGTLGSPRLQIPDADRALIWVGGRAFRMQSVTLEANNTGRRPQITIDDQASRNVIIDGMYIEANRTYGEYIHWQAMNTDASQETQALKVSNITLAHWRKGRRNCDYFIRVDTPHRSGTNTSSSRLAIHDLWARGLKGVVYCATGKHYGYDLHGIRTSYADGVNRSSGIMPSEWVTLADGAQYFPGTPYGTDHKIGQYIREWSH